MKLKRLLGGLGLALVLVAITTLLLRKERSATPPPPSAGTAAAEIQPERAAGVSQTLAFTNPVRVAASPTLVRRAETAVAASEPVVVLPPDPVRERSFADFRDWMSRYQPADATSRTALEEEGKVLAQARLAAFADLIETDPKRALQLALPVSARGGLPASVLELLEQPVNARGDLAVLATLPMAGGRSELPPVFRTATIAGETHETFTFGQGEGYVTKPGVPMNGYSVASSAAPKRTKNPLVRAQRRLLLNPNPVRVLDQSELAPLVATKGADVLCSVSGNSWSATREESAAELAGQTFTFCGASHLRQWAEGAVAAAGLETPGGAAGDLPIAQSSYTEGRKRMLLLRPYWSDHAVAMTTNSALTHWVNFSNYMWQMSYGKLAFAPLGHGSSISPDLLIPGSVNDYTAGLSGGAGSAWQAVRDVASTNYGYVLGNYDFIYYVTDNLPSAGYCGLGFVGGVGFHLANNCFDAAVSSHEYGHNLGLNHANFWDTALASIVGPGANNEYGDSNDPMGGGGNPNQFNSRYKNALGWITNSDIATISATSSNRYRLYAFDLDYGVGLRGLKFVYSGSKNYWINFRQRKTSPTLTNGVQLMWTGNGNQSSHVLDVRLKGSSSDNAVVIGRTYSDTALNFHFTPIGKGNTYPESMDVVVVSGAQPGNLPPYATLSASSLTPNPGQAVTFTATASDPNGDTLAYYWEFGDGANSYSADNQPVQSHSFASAGEYAVRCVVSDLRGGTAQHTLIVRVGNPSVFRISGHVVDVRSQPMPGSLVTAGSKSVFVDSDGSYTVPGLAAGSYTVSAREPVLGTVEFVHPFFNNPVTLGPNAQNIDFIVGTGAPPASLVLTGANWKYLDNGTDQGTAWSVPLFDDSSWSNGVSQLGYGEGDESTVIRYGPDANAKYITSYFRASFNVADPGLLTNLVLNLLRDDGIIVYLNGLEVYRDNMPAGAVNYLTVAPATAPDDGQTWQVANVSPSNLVAGANVIAAEVHQESGTSSDVTFNLSLDSVSSAVVQRATVVYVSSPADNATFTSPTNITITAGAASTPNVVTNVEIYDGAVLLSSQAAPPFMTVLAGPTDGLHTLRAISMDASGLRRTSGPVNITVGAPITPPVALSFISTGTVWRYYASNAAPAGAWTVPSFNDGGWPAGNAEFGYGEADEATIIPYGGVAANRWVSSYYRKAFVVNDPASVTSLALQLKRDDGAVVYLNGNEVVRDGLPAGPVVWGTLATNAADDGQTFIGFNLAPGLLVPGSNTLAVEIHQTALNSSDVSFDLGLSALASTNRSRGCWLTGPAEGSVIPLPGSATLTAEVVAGGNLGVTNIAFYADGALIGQDASSPFSFVWNSPPGGAHVLVAVASDSTGASITSAPVNITVSSAPVGDALISFGDVWKYSDEGTDLGTTWTGGAFNDSGWSAGPGQLGYGDGDEATVVSYGTNASFKYVTTYFRKKFVIANPAAFSGLLLRLVRDDGAVVHLNGVEVFRTNLLAGPISYNSLALAAVGAPDESTPLNVLLSTASLVAGTNTIAVEMHQDNITSSDLSFDLALTGLHATNTSQGVYLTSPANNTHYNLPATVALSASAASSAGAVTLVEYYAGAVEVGESAVTPYAANWAGVPAGLHTLTAVATYGAGLKMTSPPVTVVVGPVPSPIVPVYTNFFGFGSSWLYWDSATAVGSGWANLGFDDSAWPGGNGRFGWGLDGEATLLTPRTTHYFRKLFVITNGGALDSITFNLVRDDGAIVYLNGLEVFRTNMPAGPVDGNTLASTTINTPDETVPVEYTLAMSGGALRHGMNMVAVELHQSSAASSDGGFDLSLYGQGTTEARVYVASPAAGSAKAQGQPIEVEAQAQAAVGRSITNVEFLVDGGKIGEASAPPYRMNWLGASVGPHSVAARAADNLGGSMTSAPVQFTVGYETVSLVLIPSNSVWRFLDNGSNQGTNWSQTNFDDAAWASGPARLGYGGDGEETTVSYGPNASLKYITTYFRHAFVVPSNTFITNLTFRLVRDDGAVVHLNGREMYRSNMPAGPITSTTLASASAADEQTFFVTTLASTNVPPGTNILAVEIHQNAGNSSDLGFNLEVDGDGYVFSPAVSNPPVAFNDAYTTDRNLTLNVPAPGVLANDTNSPLTATVVTLTAHGLLSLTNNGGFSYQPTNGYIGLDTFTYRASNGTATSGVATVTITILPPPTVGAIGSAGGFFTITWPTNAPGYQLYWSAQVGLGAVWSPVNGTATVSNGLRVLTVPTTNPTAFYQLQKP